ncbi:P-loop containing nucleoside triphosphate hydrolase protein [Sporodiniella umbellata]|nr:P-loop containing nucleoside triphosphate hydrolase protein [Sporodiniella umbellata]
MNAMWLLQQLKEHDLEHFYLKLFSLRIIELQDLARISPDDYTKIGIETDEDKHKFANLSRNMKNKLQSTQNPQGADRTKRRAVSVVKATTSPVRKTTHRMTITAQIPRTPPRPSQKERPFSIPPYKDTNLQDSVSRKRTVHPTPAKRAKSSEESEKRPRLNERPAGRLLDVYGVPYSQKNKTQETDLTNEIPKRAFEPLLKTKTNVPYNEMHQRIRVCVRKRPLNKKELASKDVDIASIVGTRTVELHAEKNRIDLTRFTEVHRFTFDEAFDSHVENTEVYTRTAQPLIEYIFSGGNGTCFAYGQTGSGKTHTMLDTSDGLYVLAAQDIFRMLSQPRHSHLSAHVGFYEIYQNQLYDLLNQRNKLIARDDGNNNVVIAGLHEFHIKDQEDLLMSFNYGNQARTTGKTGVNNKSSRSHAVLQIALKTSDPASTVHGKLSFIDLAGSERGADRGDANNKTRLEGAEINKSLLALKECIRALDQDKKHAPFRGSKLTQVLRDCFVGNARTCMIATISPNSPNSDHTLNTLRYADRVKQLKGESDPRLTSDPEPITEINLEDEQDEILSFTSVFMSDEDEQVENILDVDFPSEVATSALNTPNSDRHWGTNEYEESTTNSLSGIEDLLNVQTTQMLEEKQIVQMKKRIRQFTKLHRGQIKDLEDYLKDEKKINTKMSLLVNGDDDNEDDQSDEEYVKKEYESYLNDLDEMLTHTVHCMEIVQEKIKIELSDLITYQ